MELPPELEFVEPISPDEISKFEATAGGGAVVSNFQCKIKSMVPGEYTIKTKVTTSNSGSAKGTVKVTITEGCVITIPNLYPEQPSTDRSTVITLSAYSPIVGVEITKVDMHYLAMDITSISNPIPKNETLYWSGGSQEGKSIAMEPNEFEENSWKGEIPKQKEETILAFWVVAEDNFGNRTTSPATNLEVKDLNTIHLQHNLIIWFAILGSIIGIVLIGIIWGYVNKLQVLRSTGKGIRIMGVKSQEIESRAFDDGRVAKKLNISRNIVFLVLFVVAIVLIIVAIQQGQYELLRENIGG
jgi:hypothetical protein